jgi:glucokinase-like ROK family protein
MSGEANTSISISKQVNLGRISELLRTDSPMSRAEIARRTGLTKATVSRLTEELEEQTIIRQVGAGQIDRGRHPILYEFNCDLKCVLGLQVRHGVLIGVVTNLEAAPLQHISFPLPDMRIETFLNVFEQLVEQVRLQSVADLIGVGIGIPGICDSETGTVILAENLGWSNVPLIQLIAERCNVRSYIVNRAKAAALGEKWYGAGNKANSLAYVHVGSGIGAGLISQGQLIWGENGAAGEIGHMTIIPDGPLCRCGKRGCLETLASSTAITERFIGLVRVHGDTDVQKITGHPGDQSTVLDLVKAAEAGHPLANDVLKEAGSYIGLGIANIINLFNPDHIIIGGLANYAPPVFFNAIRKSAQTHSMSIPWRVVKIVRSELKDDAVPIGAAHVLISKYFAAAQVLA